MFNHVCVIVGLSIDKVVEIRSWLFTRVDRVMLYCDTHASNVTCWSTLIYVLCCNVVDISDVLYLLPIVRIRSYFGWSGHATTLVDAAVIVERHFLLGTYDQTLLLPSEACLLLAHHPILLKHGVTEASHLLNARHVLASGWGSWACCSTTRFMLGWSRHLATTRYDWWVLFWERTVLHIWHVLRCLEKVLLP